MYIVIISGVGIYPSITRDTIKYFMKSRCFDYMTEDTILIIN